MCAEGTRLYATALSTGRIARGEIQNAPACLNSLFCSPTRMTRTSSVRFRRPSLWLNGSIRLNARSRTADAAL